jgi:hypothetical protein
MSLSWSKYIVKKYTFMKSYICVVFGPIELANVHELKKWMLISVNYECSSAACT